MKAEELIESGRRTLRASSERFSWTGDERIQATELLTAAAGHEMDDDEVVSPSVRRRFQRYVERRATGEPIPYIVGYTEFRGLRLEVRPGQFVPRDTTWFLAEQAIRRARSRAHPIVADIATGIGPVALSVAAGVPHAKVHGTDISMKAITQARRNVAALKLRNVWFHQGDMLSALPAALRGSIDVMTAHPPYVAKNEIRLLPEELREFEPIQSLTDQSRDGMGLARRLLIEAHDWLRPGGWILIEIGTYLARQMRSEVAHAGYRDVRSTAGDMQYTRVIVGRR